jgi:hemolysin activation/secretion protein
MSRWRIWLAVPIVCAVPAFAADQSVGDAPSLLGRDIAPPRATVSPDRKGATATVETASDADVSTIDAGIIQIGAVHVAGAEHLAQSDFTDIVERYVGRPTDAGGLRALARAIADRARARGYIFASAAVPRQAVDMGIVRVDLDEGAVHEVRITGSRNRSLRRVLERLIGKAIMRETVERQILLAGDLPGIAIASTRFVRENGRGVLLVAAQERRARGSAFLDNAGSRAFGPVRARLEFELDGLLDDDDRLSTYAVVTPAQPSELAFVSARYSKLIAANGTQFALTAAAGRTHAIDKTANFESIGHSRYVAASVSTPIVRGNDASFWLAGEFAYLTVDQDFMALAFQRDDLVTLTVSGTGNVRMAGGRLYGGLAFTRGLGILGATQANDPFASRADGSGEFTKVQASLNWTGKIGRGLSLRIAANGQIASRPLLSAQEIGFGGPGFGRGYNLSERFGDQGVMGLVEVRRQFDDPFPWLDWAQLYGFVDGGYVSNLDAGFGGGTLLSGGGGLRAGVGKAEMGLELAVPINAIRFDSGDKSPRLNVQVGYQF